MVNITSIKDLRQKKYYRFYEGFLAITFILFFLLIVFLSIFQTFIAANIIFGISFLWLLRVNLICLHTIYGYKLMQKWQKVDWLKLITDMSKGFNYNKCVTNIKNISTTKEWSARIDRDINVIKNNQGTQFENPYNIYQFPIFAVYTESSSVLKRSLNAIFQSKYPLNKITVFITQEERAGEAHNALIRSEIQKCNWINSYNLSEKDNQFVFNDDHVNLAYESSSFASYKGCENKLNVIFVQHPEGLLGEIKGKASNESYAGRQISLFCKHNNISPEMAITTSLDADSAIGENFFQMLVYRFVATEDRKQCGFQPIPVYSNNYFTTNFWPRLISANTTLWQFAQSSIEEEAKFFANYCVPVNVLQEINFWQTDVIAEDALCFTKSYCHYKGQFRVVPFFGVFKGDAVEADSYTETLENQYKQLQRWAWGGIECFPFIMQRLFHDSDTKDIPLISRLGFAWNEYSNHAFWSVIPTLFSIGVFIPYIFGSVEFKNSVFFYNYTVFSSLFAWISLIVVSIFSYLTLVFISSQKGQNITVGMVVKIIYQSFFASFVYGAMGIPAIDSQLRGLRGKYLGYWVTPKK